MSLSKHKLLCDIVHQCIQTIEEENDVLPNQSEMVKIVKQLVHQYHLLEKRIASLERKMTPKHTKPQVIPICSLQEWIHEPNLELDKDRLLQELTQLDIVSAFLLFLESKKKQTKPVPIEIHPENRWYVYDETDVWRKMKKEDWIPLLTHIHAEILKKVLLPWKIENQEKINRDETFGEKTNKMILKFMSVDVIQDIFIHKIKVGWIPNEEPR
jgi:hypothetical protein